jgi:hypothetical protein
MTNSAENGRQDLPTVIMLAGVGDAQKRVLIMPSVGLTPYLSLSPFSWCELGDAF